MSRISRSTAPHAPPRPFDQTARLQSAPLAQPTRPVRKPCGFCSSFPPVSRLARFRFTLARCTARSEVCLIAAASREHALVGGEIAAVDDGRCGLAQSPRRLPRPILHHCNQPARWSPRRLRRSIRLWRVHHLLRGVGNLGSFQDVQRQPVLAKKRSDCILGKFIGCRADHDLRDRTG